MADSRDRLTSAHQELARSHGARTDVGKWLTETDSRMESLRARMGDLDGMSDRVATTEAALERMNAMAQTLERRESFVLSVGTEPVNDNGTLYGIN